MMRVIDLRREQDGNGFHLYFTGGVRAAKISEDEWMIEPVLTDGKPCAEGPFPLKGIQKLSNGCKLKPIAFHQFGWIDGNYNSHWIPITSNKKNHSDGVATIWGKIASNIGHARNEDFFETTKRPTEAEIVQVLDDQNPAEAFARYINLSLRSSDISIEQIADYYHEQLVNDIASGSINGEKSDNTRSQALYAHVHSFLLHLGMSRDYLGALIAHRIGLDEKQPAPHKKTDSMAKLIDRMRKSNLPQDKLLNLLFDRGDIVQDLEKPDRFKLAGWMKDVTNIRNELVHRRPYGSKFREKWGWTTRLQRSPKLFRYFRPIELNGNTEQDVLDLLQYHYRQCNDLMLKAAEVSGYTAKTMQITADDVISLQVNRNKNSEI